MLGIISKIYGSIVKIKNAKFNDESAKPFKCGVPVFSVGNLTVGGTGKTPFVEMLARQLIKFGHKPAIVGRGYKRKSKGEIIVCNGREILADVDAAGDEMLLLAEKLMVPVIAHDDKTEGAKAAVRDFEIDSIIVDDGFQHRKLFRDMDIILIDKETLDNSALLPKGRLREPFDGVSRADVICFVGNATPNEELKQFIHQEQLVLNVGGKSERPYELFSKRIIFGKKLKEMKTAIVALAGIANPDRFEKMLQRHNYNIIKFHKYPDHHNYTKQDIESVIKSGAEGQKLFIATTEKDAMKLVKFEQLFISNDISVCVFPFSIRIFSNRTEFNRKIKGVFRNHKNKTETVSN
jgi:tetraacyldisaccharide 4'-kinase